MIVAAPLIVFIGRSASILYESGISVEKPPYRIFCGHCGNPLSPEDKFCGNCGKPVSQT
ncbi:MAG: zinc ribbon domain-containing protein [Nitrososphaerota archaeon]